MSNNTFTVDLGNVQLTAQHREAINGAIQKAVTGELAKINLKSQIVLIPAAIWIKGHILNGIIVRPVNEKFITGMMKEF